jgi:3-hydroxymyristoyl/3-hydroxydecanoyl-(acyl carrier protein) dehydratase
VSSGHVPHQMDGHFCAFSFVDRITSLQQESSIRGQYAIPPKLDAFPVSLVAEAVGQLAAWAAMTAVDFTHRPVAGIAGRIELLSIVQPGQVLDLGAELESVDIDTVGYCGTACVGGRPVIRLLDCVGPMVPLNDFDEPDAMRERCGLLRTVGATPGGFPGLPALAMEHGECERGQLARAVLRVPSSAPFFADHFPRRPVFPGTLLMHSSMQTAAMAVEAFSGNGATWLPRAISNMKLRSFISPGVTLNLEARITRSPENGLTVATESRIDERLVGTADVQFSPGEP